MECIISEFFFAVFSGEDVIYQKDEIIISIFTGEIRHTAKYYKVAYNMKFCVLFYLFNLKKVIANLTIKLL